ncbi:MAG: DUF1566 domain-containing protein [Magnetococcus sp. DMHC-6]
MNKGSAGFGLIGLAMTMIILTIFLSTLLLLAPNMETVAREKTVTLLKANKQALIGYAITNGRLPVSADYGSVVPSLTDGYHNNTYYAFDSRLTATNGICANPSTYISIDTLPNHVVAFVIWSNGRNGVINPTPTPIKTAGAQVTDVTIYNSSYSVGSLPNDSSDDIDDILEWVTLDELKKFVGCEEIESLNIVSQNFPIGRQDSFYSTADLFANKGISPYAWCIEMDSAPMTPMTLLDKLIFQTTGSLPNNIIPDNTNSSYCSILGNFVQDGGDKNLNISGNAIPFEYSDINYSGHKIKIFLKDDIGNNVNRLFKLIVKGLQGAIQLTSEYSKEFLSTVSASSYTIGDSIYNALQGIGVSWYEIHYLMPRFTDNGDGTITDNLTRLIWLKDADCWPPGQTWNDALNIISNEMNGGTKDCTNYSQGTYHDWRLPNINELESLINVSRPSTTATPALPSLPNGHPFSNLQMSHYWSSTTVFNEKTKAWSVDFSDGKSAITELKTDAQSHIWPVRGTSSQVAKTGVTQCWDENGNEITPCTSTGQDGELQQGVPWPTPRFIENMTYGTVTDKLTGLIWMKNANCWWELPPNDTTTRTWTHALTYIKALRDGEATCLNFNANGPSIHWRLPNRLELRSLMDASQYNPAILSGHPFSNIQANYWSSTPDANDPDHVWTIDLTNGTSHTALKSDTGYYVWPVGGGE